MLQLQISQKPLIESHMNGSYINLITMGFVALFYNGYNIFWRIAHNKLHQRVKKALPLRLHQVFHKEPFWPHYYFCATYINDLPDQVKSKVRLHADDILLYTTHADCLICDQIFQRGLIHVQFQVSLSRSFNRYNNRPTVHACTIAKVSTVCFY